MTADNTVSIVVIEGSRRPGHHGHAHGHSHGHQGDQQPNTHPHPRIPAAKLFLVFLWFSMFSATSGNPEVGGGDNFWGFLGEAHGRGHSHAGGAHDHGEALGVGDWCEKWSVTPREYLSMGYGLRLSTEIYGRKRFPTKTYRKCVLCLQKSPGVSGSLRDNVTYHIICYLMLCYMIHYAMLYHITRTEALEYPEATDASSWTCTSEDLGRADGPRTKIC